MATTFPLEKVAANNCHLHIDRWVVVVAAVVYTTAVIPNLKLKAPKREMMAT